MSAWREHEYSADRLPLAVRHAVLSPEHPRWLLVLPNGDLLVAESNAPSKPDADKGIKAWITSLVMKRADAVLRLHYVTDDTRVSPQRPDLVARGTAARTAVTR